MKFKAEKNRLSEAVIIASKACASKSPFNALDGVLLRLEDDILTITGYDLEIGILAKVKVKGHIDGEVVIDAKLFSDTVRRMPSSTPVEITVVDEKEVNISAGNAFLTIQGVSGNNFPNIIELNESINFKVKENILKNMLSQVNHATAQSDINPSLKGVRFEITNGELTLVATDGMRLALTKEKVDYSDIAFIMPEKTVMELTRNLTDSTENDVTIIIDNNQICVMKEDYTIFSRLLDGKYLDYKKVINFIHSREVVINSREFIGTLERSLLLINEKFKSPIIFTLKETGEKVYMIISCKTNLGSLEEKIEVDYKLCEENIDPNFSIAFNPKFILDAVKNSLTDEIRILLTAPLSPLKIVPINEGDFLFVVVPVRLE